MLESAGLLSALQLHFTFPLQFPAHIRHLHTHTASLSHTNSQTHSHPRALALPALTYTTADQSLTVWLPRPPLTFSPSPPSLRFFWNSTPHCVPLPPRSLSSHSLPFVHFSPTPTNPLHPTSTLHGPTGHSILAHAYSGRHGNHVTKCQSPLCGPLC